MMDKYLKIPLKAMLGTEKVINKMNKYNDHNFITLIVRPGHNRYH